jgi:hypothetical protein
MKKLLIPQVLSSVFIVLSFVSFFAGADPSVVWGTLIIGNIWLAVVELQK